MDKDQTTTPGTTCPTLYDECVDSLTSPTSHYSEDAGDGPYGLSFLSEKTRISDRLQMLLQRQYILLSYFMTLSVCPVWGSAVSESLTEKHLRQLQHGLLCNLTGLYRKFP